jgi:hypothetical protein
MIRAPFAGVLGLSTVTPGTLVNPGAVITTLDDIDVVRVDFPVPERYLGVLRPGTAISATIDAYGDEVFSGRIALIDTRINETDPRGHRPRRNPQPRRPHPPRHGRARRRPAGPAPDPAVPEAAVQYEGRRRLRLSHRHRRARLDRPARRGRDRRRRRRLRRDRFGPVQRRQGGRRRPEPHPAQRAGAWVGGGGGAGGQGGRAARLRPRAPLDDALRRRVRRPVFAAVAAIVLCVIGAAAFFFLPVRELPDVDPPVVSINTSYAGASAEVIENRITEPIEQQIAGIQGVERITSSSRDGRSSVTIEFSLDRNIDDAANDVRDRGRPRGRPPARTGRSARGVQGRQRLASRS